VALLVNDHEISKCTTAVVRQRIHKHTDATIHRNNCTATEERCFLCSPCRDFISRTSEESVS
jgi:hypothetical protein